MPEQVLPDQTWVTANGDQISEGLKTPILDNFLKQTFNPTVLSTITEKWIERDVSLWGMLLDMTYAIMQMDPYDHRKKMKTISFNSTTDMAAFWLEMYEDHREIFYRAMACDENGAHFSDEERPDFESGQLRCKFRIKESVINVKLADTTLTEFRTKIGIGFILDIFFRPPDEYMFTGRGSWFITLDHTPVNELYLNDFENRPVIEVADNSDSAFNSESDENE